MKGENICRIMDFFHGNTMVSDVAIKVLANQCELPTVLSSDDKLNMRCINYEDGLHLAVTFFPEGKYTAILWFESRDKRVELGYWEK